MKPLLTTLAALSLGANVALVALLFAGYSGSAESSAAPTATAPAPKASAPTGPSADTWARLSTDDLPTMVRKLQEANVPIEFIRALAAARINESFSERRKALRAGLQNQPFWKNETTDPRIRVGEYQLYREQRKALRDLLGADAESPETNLYNTRRYDSVPADKIDDVKDAYRMFEDRRQELFSQLTGGTLGPEMQKRMQELQKEFDATLATILTPAQLEDYNLRNGDTANQLRYELAAFNPSEEEFRSIHRLRAQLEPYRGTSTPEEMQRRSEAQRQINDQIKAMLGPVRGEEFTRANDHYYRQTSQLVSRLELPAETTTKIWELRQDIEKRARAVYSDSSLNPETRAQQLTALRQETDQQLQGMLGTRGMEPYRQYGGEWMRMLTPQPAATRTPSGGTSIIRTGP